MKNNPEEIPAEIFDWIETRAFSELTHREKETVLTYLSEDEYTAMCQANRSIRRTKPIQESSRKKKLKEDLLFRFAGAENVNDNIHKQSNPVFLWKSVAAVLFAIVLFAGFFLVKKHNTIESALGTDKDTVYVNKEITKTIEKHDTVYLYRNVFKQASSNQTELPEMIMPDEEDFMSPEDINTIPVTDFKNVKNEPRGNSMKYDSIDRILRFSTF